ncbi:hypothetical protein CLOM_g9675 [Closterium sp. NIES-68]|nr:hypothetical protein CLOM_g9675 [Closterium sp. NIES-68]
MKPRLQQPELQARKHTSSSSSSSSSFSSSSPPSSHTAFSLSSSSPHPSQGPMALSSPLLARSELRQKPEREGGQCAWTQPQQAESRGRSQEQGGEVSAERREPVRRQATAGWRRFQPWSTSSLSSPFALLVSLVVAIALLHRAPVVESAVSAHAYEIQKLLALKDAFSQYVPAALPSWSVEGGDPCKNQWKEGKIACNTAGRVIRLNLSNQNLKGPLPGQELAKLVALRRLDLGFNNFTGEIPIELADLSSITYLSLESNQIEGAIPEWIGTEWPTLVHLRLASNQFAGQIPNGFGQLKNLVMLDMASNQLSGSIPTDIQVCSRLEQLSLSGNSLSGPLPTWIGNLKQLRVLEMFSNNLSGTIPAEIAQATSLESIALDDNDLSGTLPDALGNLPSLAALYMASNLLEGPIPYSYHRLNGLMYIDLSYNTGINGTVPEYLGNLWLLESIAFENCNLTGSIPASLGALSLLVEIFLDNNKLTGSIPETLGGLESINKLYLNQNFLEGSVPTSLCNLTNAREINLSKNGLTGDLPLCMVTLPHITSLLVSYNQLSGDVPDIPADSKLFFRYDHNCYEGMPDQSPCAEPSFTSDGTTTTDGGSNDYAADNATWSDTTADDYQQFYDSNNPEGGSQAAQNTQPSSSHTPVFIYILLPLFAVLLACIAAYHFSHKFRDAVHVLVNGRDKLGVTEFDLKRIKKATGNFTAEYGRGSFGVVFLADEFFKGQPEPRAIIKRAHDPHKVSEFLFKCKVEVLAKARHRYVVNLHGYCVNQGERILVYEFLPNGTLFDRLHRPELEPLAWETRVRVAYHIASALEHLHHDLTPPLVHRAVTSSNVLLAADMTAKLSDFGIAKGSSGGNSAFDDTPRRKKSRKHKQVADVQSPSPQMEKVDVYGFGVVLLELITGQKAMKEVHITTMAAPFLEDPQMMPLMVDPYLGGNYRQEELIEMGALARDCIQENAASRPSMREVLERMEESFPSVGACMEGGGKGGEDEETGLLVEGYSAAPPTFGQGVTHLHPPQEQGSAVMREERQVTGISGISAPASAWASIEGFARSIKSAIGNPRGFMGHRSESDHEMSSLLVLGAKTGSSSSGSLGGRCDR